MFHMEKRSRNTLIIIIIIESDFLLSKHSGLIVSLDNLVNLYRMKYETVIIAQRHFHSKIL